MIRMNRVPLLAVSSTCAFIVVLVFAGRASCLAIPYSPAQQLVTTRTTSVQNEIKLANDGIHAGQIIAAPPLS